jgi:hypothetical protein
MARTSGWITTRVRSFVGWLRHVTLVLLVLALLTVICTKERLSCAASESNQTPPFPIALTVPEVRCLLGRLLFPLARSAAAVLAREVVASMSTSQSQRLACQGTPQLQLVGVRLVVLQPHVVLRCALR